MSKPTLIYFAGRGRAELIRIVLAEAGVEYQEHHLAAGQPPINGRPADFAALKATGTLPFDAVPVWEEPDGFRLAQSAAIARYLARAHGLDGKTPRHLAECDQILGGVDDLRFEMRKLVSVTAEERPALRQELSAATVPRWLGYFDRLLRANRGGAGFLVGDALTIADLALWYLCEQLRDNGLGAGFATFPTLARYLARVGQRPRLAEYVKSAGRPPFVALPV